MPPRLAVVRQVLRNVLEVAAARAGVRGRGEAAKALVEEPEAQRVDGGEQHVDAQVELEALDEEGPRLVLLCNGGRARVLQVVERARKVDAAALA